MKSKTGFSLIEMLVVMAVISLLAAMIYPAYHSMTERASKVQCQNNLMQIGMQLKMYHDDRKARRQYPLFPASLTGLVKDKVIENPEMLLCPSDRFEGKEGCRPPTRGSVDFDDGTYEMNDRCIIDGKTIYTSYSYEFSGQLCPYGRDKRANGDSTSYNYPAGTVTWWQMKLAEHKEDSADVPIIRCFWHAFTEQEFEDGVYNVFNLRYNDFKSVYRSGPKWEDNSTKKE